MIRVGWYHALRPKENACGAKHRQASCNHYARWGKRVTHADALMRKRHGSIHTISALSQSLLDANVVV